MNLVRVSTEGNLTGLFNQDTKIRIGPFGDGESVTGF
jgi:hypothetical protein